MSHYNVRQKNSSLTLRDDECGLALLGAFLLSFLAFLCRVIVIVFVIIVMIGVRDILVLRITRYGFNSLRSVGTQFYVAHKTKSLILVNIIIITIIGVVVVTIATIITTIGIAIGIITVIATLTIRVTVTAIAIIRMCGDIKRHFLYTHLFRFVLVVIVIAVVLGVVIPLSLPCPTCTHCLGNFSPIWMQKITLRPMAASSTQTTPSARLAMSVSAAKVITITPLGAHRICMLKGACLDEAGIAVHAIFHGEKL